MNRYADTATALEAAMTLMVEQGDTLLIAMISHPLSLARQRALSPHDDDGRLPQDPDASAPDG